MALKRNQLLLLLLGLTLVHGLLYTAVIPPWQAPDEPTHFAWAQIPVVHAQPDPPLAWQQTRDETIASLFTFRFWDWLVRRPAVHDMEAAYHYAPVGLEAKLVSAPRTFVYYLPAPVLSLTRPLGPTWQMYMIRFLSVLTNLGVVAVAFWVGRLLFGDDRFAALLPAAIVFLPQHTFILASVTDNNPSELLASLAIGCLVWGIVRGFRWHNLALTGLFGGLAVIAKPTAFFLLPPVMLLLAVAGWRRLHGRQRWLLIPGIGLLFGGVFLVSSRFQNWVLRILEGRFFIEGIDHSLSGTWQTLTTTDPLSALSSFWAVLGWYSLPISLGWRYVLLVICLLSLIGLAWGAIRHVRARGWQGGPIWRAAWIFVLFVLVDFGLLVAASAAYGAALYAGRYLFGAIIPIMALLVIGWRQIVPAGWRTEWMAVLVSLFFVFDTAVLAYYALPFFYPLWH